jgi:uncharacterized protein (DUF1684 family)
VAGGVSVHGTDSSAARAKHREHIEKRTEFVRGKRGPVSFVWGNHVVKPRQRVPGAPGLWSPLREGEAGLLVEASARDGIAINGCTVDGDAKLEVDPNHPASIACFPNGAEGIIFTYDNKRFALQVWNPKSAWAQQFSHIQAFDWSADWIVDARVEKVRDGMTLAIAHHRNPIPVERPVAAKVTFHVGGVEHTLYATRREDNYVLHFTDGSSGHTSYSYGRNVRIPADQSGDVRIDFNYSTLLPCSFSRAWNCPIPPLENRLRVPIEAGERFAVDHDGVPML